MQSKQRDRYAKRTMRKVVLDTNVLISGVIASGYSASILDAARREEIKLDEAALKKLDEIWPGPGGTAPEAYAW